MNLTKAQLAKTINCFATENDAFCSMVLELTDRSFDRDREAGIILMAI
jgi:hypothetical protein